METLPRFNAARMVREGMHERMLEHGAHTLSDCELLALALPARKRCNHTFARELLVRFGSLRSLLTAARPALRDAGLTQREVNALLVAMELTRRHYSQLMQTGTYLNNPRATKDYVHMRLRDLEHEIFSVIYLDNRNRVLSMQELFRGTIDGASVHVREVVKEALARNAAAMVLVHNHPSGVAEPSHADELITKRIKQAVSLVDIRLLDHLVVGDGVTESFAERGLL